MSGAWPIIILILIICLPDIGKTIASTMKMVMMLLISREEDISISIVGIGEIHIVAEN